MSNFKYIILIFILFMGCTNNSRMDREQIFEAYSNAKGDTVLIDKNGNRLEIVKDTSRDIVNELLKSNHNQKVVDRSINGRVIYTMDLEGRKTSVLNMDYSKEYFVISITNDTIKQNKYFSAKIAGGIDELTINIDNEDKKLNLNDLPYTYQSKAEKLGVNEFSGSITTAKRIYPFSYKYIVIK